MTESYSLWGSSAGSRMTWFIGAHGMAAFGGHDLPKPSAIVVADIAHPDSRNNKPRTFVIVRDDDSKAPPSSMADRVETLRLLRTRVSYTAYPELDHGFGLGTATTEDGSVKDAVDLWTDR